MLSVENLDRAHSEVATLFEIIEATLRDIDRAGSGRIRHLGDSSLLPPPLRRRFEEIERTTAERAGPAVNLAVAYSGRHEILQAIRDLAGHDPSIRNLDDLAARIGPDQLHAHVASSAIPVDLVLRTSGERRSSGFLLWTAQDAYLCFQNTLWPDYTRDNLVAAIRESLRIDAKPER
jgi:short-chain Z-isoprenyl diphosphate synthase